MSNVNQMVIDQFWTNLLYCPILKTKFLTIKSYVVRMFLDVFIPSSKSVDDSFKIESGLFDKPF